METSWLVMGVISLWQSTENDPENVVATERISCLHVPCNFSEQKSFIIIVML